MMNQIVLLAPLTGRVVPLAEVPDAVFSSGMLGDGVGIAPVDGRLLAPCAGTVSQLADTGHALTITTHDGVQVLLHVGIDTVELGGEGFRALVREGARVSAGEVLLEFDLDLVLRRASSAVSVMVIANGEAFGVDQRGQGEVLAGRTPLLTLRVAGGMAGRHVGAEVGQLSGAPASTAADTAAGMASRRSVRLTGAGGLHARPAARAREAARGLAAQVEVHFDGKRASLDSVVALLGLGAGEQAEVELVGTGPQAELALEAIARELTRDVDSESAYATLAANASAGPAERAARGPAAEQGAGPAAEQGAEPAAEKAAGPAATPGILRGVCAAPGLAVGTLVRLDHGEIDVPESAAATPQSERTRLDHALAAVDTALADAVHQAKQRDAQGTASIFNVHRILLQDPTLLAAAHDLILRGKSAGHAWRTAVRAQIDILSRLTDHLLAERAADLRDVEQRVLRALGHTSHANGPLPDHAVLAAEEFTPSALAALDRQRVVALLMARGGATSHAAIIARQLGIPTLVALGANLHALPAGGQVIVDATAGRLQHAPTAFDIEQAQRQRLHLQAERDANRKLSTTPATTRDGHHIEVAANIATLEDARSAIEHGADAIGLLRTELLFTHRQAAPTASEHRDSYQSIIDVLQGRRAIIRTLDVGNDKSVDYLTLPTEQNPALGLRGIRLARQWPQLFDHQLQGLLSTQPFGAVRILLPMVSDLPELLAIRQRIDDIARSLGRSDAIEVGVMIEVPSAALLADQLARHADFLSIGTNDLTQYTLAMDRCHPALAAPADGLHPAVLRLIDATVRGARQHGKWVGVCGALAGDAVAVPILLGLGVTELSVDALAVPRIKARVRELDYEHCRQLAREALALDSAPAVRAYAGR